MDGERPANLGQCFIAINPACFAPDFPLRMSDMMGLLRNLDPVRITLDLVLLYFFKSNYTGNVQTSMKIIRKPFDVLVQNIRL